MRFLKNNGVWMDRGRVAKTSPIQTSPRDDTVPLVVAEEAYLEYASLYGTRQSLEDLENRGGFGSTELALLLFMRLQRVKAELEKERSKPCPQGESDGNQ